MAGSGEFCERRCRACEYPLAIGRRRASATRPALEMAAPNGQGKAMARRPGAGLLGGRWFMRPRSPRPCHGRRAATPIWAAYGASLGPCGNEYVAHVKMRAWAPLMTATKIATTHFDSPAPSGALVADPREVADSGRPSAGVPQGLAARRSAKALRRAQPCGVARAQGSSGLDLDLGRHKTDR